MLRCVMLCSDSSSSVILGGRAFMEKFDQAEKSGERYYSFMTNSSRLYSFIDDMLDDDAVDIDMDMDMDEAMLGGALSDEAMIQVEDLRGGWHPSHDDEAYIGVSSHSMLGGDGLFSIGPVTLTDIHPAEVSLHTPHYSCHIFFLSMTYFLFGCHLLLSLYLMPDGHYLRKCGKREVHAAVFPSARVLCERHCSHLLRRGIRGLKWVRF